MPIIDLNGLGHFKDKENAMVADKYSATKTYAVGDYCYYNGTLYRCTTAITTAEAWTVGHWTAAKIADDLTAQSEAIDYQLDMLTIGEHDVALTYSNGLVSSTDGTIAASTSYKISQLVKVWEGVEVTFKTFIGSGGLALSLYANENSNADLTFSVQGTYVQGQTGTVTIPPGIEYVRLCVAVEYLSSAELSFEYENAKYELHVDGKIYNPDLFWSNGAILASDGSIASPSSYRYSNLVPVKVGQRVEFSCNGWGSVFALAYYSDSSSSALNTSIKGNGDTSARNVVIPNGVNYIRLCTDNSATSTSYAKISDFDSIPYQLKNIKADIKRNPLGGYIHARRPTIAFMFDGEYNKNKACHDLLASHGYVCTFDIQYDTAFAYNSKADYLVWQSEGFEIAAHSSKPVGNQSGSGTDEQVNQIIKDAYTTLTEYGFDIRSFVSLSGQTRSSAYPTIERYYECAFTIGNHSGSQESNIALTEDQYELWRYGLETSTVSECKDAVDRCESITGLLIFYTHANGNSQDFDIDDIDELLDYIDSKGIQVLTAYDAVSDFFAIRRSDLS